MQLANQGDPPSPLLVIAGLTATGKTRLALELADHAPIEVISADSRQVYRGLDIGTAKPTPAERKRVPHHLVDIIDPGEVFSAHRFSEMARTAIAGIESRGARPVLVGGTGFYIQALLTAGPPRRNAAVYGDQQPSRLEQLAASPGTIAEWLYGRLYVFAGYHARIVIVAGAPEEAVTQVLHQATHAWHIRLTLARAKRGRWRAELRCRFSESQAVETDRPTPCEPLRMGPPGRIAPAGELPAPPRTHGPGGTPLGYLDQRFSHCVVALDTPV